MKSIEAPVIGYLSWRRNSISRKWQRNINAIIEMLPAEMKITASITPAISYIGAIDNQQSSSGVNRRRKNRPLS